VQTFPFNYCQMENVTCVDDFKQLAGASEESFCLSDGKNILFANQNWLSSYGYASEEVVGQTFKILQGPESDTAAIQALMDASALKKPFQGTLTNYTSQGVVVEDTLTVTPFLDSHFIVRSSVVPKQ